MSIKGFFVNGQIQRYDYGALDNKQSGVSEAVRDALLQLAQKVAYIDENGQDYYQDLYDALYASSVEITSISALFSQGSTVVYTTDTLNSLKPMLTVTANYSDGSSETVTSYSLYGTLTAGTSTINVFYEGFSTTFDVTVTAVAGVYTITNTLSNCTSSNSATTIQENSSYAATITASTGYTLFGATVSVTMGGVNVTSTSYSNGTISIASVTGDLVITVTAAAKELSSISAVYTQSNVVYTTDTLNSLKSDLVVTANYADSSTQTVPAADYTLSGTLTTGTSTITVSYQGETDTFTVSVNNGFLYTPDRGLLSAQPYITFTNPTAQASFSETIVDDALRFYCPKLDSASGRFVYAFAPTLFNTYCKLTIEFKIADMSWVTATNAHNGWAKFQLASNSSSCATALGFARLESNTGELDLRYISSSAVTKQPITVNSWHTLEVVVENNKQTITLNGTTIATEISAANYAPSFGVMNSFAFDCGNTNANDIYFRKIEFMSV